PYSSRRASTLGPGRAASSTRLLGAWCRFLCSFAVSVPAPQGIDLGRIFFWTAITLALAALPVRLPGGVVVHTTTAPLIAAVFDSGLANPFAVCWIAFVGTLELREIGRASCKESV